MTPIIETKRTIIDRITLDDAPFFVELVNSPGWLKYIGDRNVSNVDDACRYLESGFLTSYRDNRFSYYLIRLRDQTPIGICGFLRKPNLENPDFGFALLPEYVGQGYAFESSRAVLDFGIVQFDFSVLDAVVSPDNERSMRLLDKLDFQRIGTVESHSDDDKLLLYRWHKASQRPR